LNGATSQVSLIETYFLQTTLPELQIIWVMSM